jgi:hypothetical protein
MNKLSKLISSNEKDLSQISQQRDNLFFCEDFVLSFNEVANGFSKSITRTSQEERLVKKEFKGFFGSEMKIVSEDI